MERRFPAAQAVDDQFHALQSLSHEQFAAERQMLDEERGRHVRIAAMLAGATVLVWLVAAVGLVH